METLSVFMPLFTAGIFFISFLALLLTGFNYMLKPLKDNQARMEDRQARMEDRQARMETEIKDIKNTLKLLLK